MLLRFCLSSSGIEATICWWLRAAAQHTASEVGRKWLRAAARQGTECCSTVCMTVREGGLQHSKQDCEAARRCSGSSCLQGANSCSTAGLAGRLLDPKLALSKAYLRLFIPAYNQIRWGSCGPKGPQADSRGLCPRDTMRHTPAMAPLGSCLSTGRLNGSSSSAGHQHPLSSSSAHTSSPMESASLGAPWRRTTSIICRQAATQWAWISNGASLPLCRMFHTRRHCVQDSFKC